MQLINYYPEFLQESERFAKLQEAMSGEVELLRENLREILLQCNIDTATWGLALWEKQLSMLTDETLSDEDRRVNIKAKLQGMGTTTVAEIKRVAELYSGGEVLVEEQTAAYTFSMTFVGGKGIPNQIEELQAVIELIKPAHLQAIYVYIYNMHQDLRPYTQQQLARWTHIECRESEEV